MQGLWVGKNDEFPYLTLVNWNYASRTLDVSVVSAVSADLLKGLYRFEVIAPTSPASRRLRLLGSGAILREVLLAAQVLAQEHGVRCEVFSATSYSELAREAQQAQRSARTAPPAPTPQSPVALLPWGPDSPVAACESVRAWSQLIAELV